jgi:hypothetical protein
MNTLEMHCLLDEVETSLSIAINDLTAAREAGRALRGLTDLVKQSEAGQIALNTHARICLSNLRADEAARVCAKIWEGCP